MEYSVYLDKIYGGWIGKCLGGAAGAPVEGYKKIIEHEHYSEVIRTDLPNDDLDLQLLWLEVLQKKGLDIGSKDLAFAWDKQCWYPFSEYGLFLKNYERGIMPPYSGGFNNPLFKEGEGCPIRSEIWGMVFAGYPEVAAKYANMDGVLDHEGSSVWIEQFYSAIEANAFYENDILKLINDNKKFLPKTSEALKCVDFVLKEFENNTKDWQLARTRLLRKYAHNEFTNSIPNLGLVIIALLYGNGDLDKTVNIAFRSGYDTDCTCATAGAILGIIMGAGNISPKLKELTGDNFVAGIELDRTDFTILGLSKETALIGLMADSHLEQKINNIPNEIKIPNIIDKKPLVDIRIDYKSIPSISPIGPCEIEITVSNFSDNDLEEVLQINDLPRGWKIDKNNITLYLKSKEVKKIEFKIMIKEANVIADKNILSVTFGQFKETFGICGANVWQAIGPFLEPMEGEDDIEEDGQELKLPPIECMVNNAVYLDKKYIAEKDFKTEFENENFQYMFASEDLLPTEENFTYHGQGCIYLRRTVISPEDRNCWIVLGNNDGFVMWVNGNEVIRKDEVRLWTPYNYYFTVDLKKGENEIVLKLLRRTETLKFGFGFRKNEGEFFHRKRWYTDLVDKFKLI